MKFRTQYDPYDKRLRPKLKCEDPSRTDQSQFESTEINHMLELFRVTGQPPSAAVRPPTFDDFTVINDFTTARAAIIQAEQAFLQMDPQLRAKLGNDPQRFIEYLADPKNKQELQERGYILPDKQSAPTAPTPSPAPAGAPDPAPAPTPQS